MVVNKESGPRRGGGFIFLFFYWQQEMLKVQTHNEDFTAV